MKAFSIPIRVYIEDTDAGGIVFYANYLKYMERARTEWLRSFGIELDTWQEQLKTLFVVKAVNIEYASPARFNDQLTAGFELIKCKKASLQCRQSIMRQDNQLSTALVTLVCVNADTMAPQAIPKILIEAISVEP